MTVQYVAGAYFLIKPGSSLTPGVLTASSCLADMAPDSWAIEWVKTKDSEREEHAERLGIRARDLPAVVRWSTEHLDGRGIGWPNVFHGVEIAREFRRLFLAGGVHLLGIALPRDLVAGFLGLAAPPPQERGYAPVGATGVYEVLRTGRPLAAGGTRRGFEVLGYDDAGQFHSFRCNELDRDFERHCGATFNAWGVVDDESIARCCANYASRPEVGTCAEAWHPWLLEEYELGVA